MKSKALDPVAKAQSKAICVVFLSFIHLLWLVTPGLVVLGCFLSCLLYVWEVGRERGQKKKGLSQQLQQQRLGHTPESGK